LLFQKVQGLFQIPQAFPRGKMFLLPISYRTKAIRYRSKHIRKVVPLPPPRLNSIY